MTLFLLLLIAAIILGLIGAVVEGLFYLLVIGAAVLLIAIVFGSLRLRRGARRPRR